MATLYRKYRPQYFHEVVGQRTTKNTLQNAIISKNIVHSYLFSGPRGTGKTTIARILAKSLNCLNRHSETAEPCNTCQICQAINQNAFVDLIEIDAASNRGIDEIRSLKEAIRFAPSHRHGYKIYIIDEAHMLTKDASNALLKTLEEPPENVIFILATTDPEKLLPTILSRTQRFDFTSLSASDIKIKLQTITAAENITIDDTVLDRVVMMAMGGARDAESLLGKILSQHTSHITPEIADAILGKNSIQEIYRLCTFLGNRDVSSSLQHIHTLFDHGYHMDQLMNQSIAIIRQLVLATISQDLIDTRQFLATEQEQIKTISQQQPLHFWAHLLENLEEYKSHIHSAYLPVIPFELALIRSLTSSEATEETSSSGASHTPLDSPISKSSPEQPQQQSPNQPLNTHLSPPSSRQVPPNPFRSSQNSSSSSSPPKIKEEPSSYSSLDITTIKNQQNALRKALKDHNKTLVSVFDKARPLTYYNTCLTFYIDSEFYRSRLEKHITEIQNICRTLWNTPEMTIRFTSDKEDDPSSYQEDTPQNTPPFSQTSQKTSQPPHNLDFNQSSLQESPLSLKEKVTSVFHDYLEDES